jgi:divalent metal cation (Fe/Co/Zn/Cd) transporter
LSRTGEEFSVPGITVAVVAIPAMYILARAELRIAEQLESRALRADAIESLTCGYLSVVVAVGLLGDLVFKAWWVDGVTSVAIVWLLIREGREAWAGERCCDD